MWHHLNAVAKTNFLPEEDFVKFATTTVNSEKFGIVITLTELHNSQVNTWNVDNLIKAFKNQYREKLEQVYTSNDVLLILEEYDREFKLDTNTYTKTSSFTVKEWWKKKFNNINLKHEENR